MPKTINTLLRNTNLDIGFYRSWITDFETLK